jgi:hypothetical protein
MRILIIHTLVILLNNNTLSIPNYLSVWIGTQILKNLEGICKSAHLIPHLDLNQLSNELYCTQNGAVNKQI